MKKRTIEKESRFQPERGQLGLLKRKKKLSAQAAEKEVYWRNKRTKR